MLKKIFLKKFLRYGIPLIISFGLCYLLFTGIDFNEMIETIRNECNFWWIGLALVLSVFSHIFRAMRWRILLRALKINAPLSTVVYSVFGTYAVNLVFPRLGEIWRTSYIAHRQKASFTTVFGSMLADRLADGLMVLLLTFVAFIWASGAISKYLSQNAKNYDKFLEFISSLWLWVVIVAIVAIIWWLFTKKRDNKIISGIIDIIKGLWTGFIAIFKMKGKWTWVLLSFAIWGCYFSQLFVTFFAFEETTAVFEKNGIIVVLVCFVLSSIAMGVPSNGGIGPWQWAVIFGLSIYGMSQKGGVALAFANLVLGSQTLLIIGLGIYTFIAVTLEKKKLKDSSPN